MEKKALIPVYSDSPEILPGFEGPVGYRGAKDLFVYSERFKEWMFEYQCGRCGYCGVNLGATWMGNRKAHVEHIVARRQGGSDLPPNVMYACSKCNMQKRDNHFSSLADRIQLSAANLDKVITVSQAKQLTAMGIDLGMKPINPFYFSRMNWAHVQPAVEVDRQRMAEEFELCHGGN